MENAHLLRDHDANVREPQSQLGGTRTSGLKDCAYWIELATDENTLLALDPMSLIVPTTTARITANMIAYSAMSCPSSPLNLLRTRIILDPREYEAS